MQNFTPLQNTIEDKIVDGIKKVGGDDALRPLPYC